MNSFFKFFFVVVGVAAVGLLAACAAPTRIATNKSQDYTTEPKRIYVYTDVGSDFGAEYAEGFRSKAVAIARKCEAELEIDWVNPLELNEDAVVNKILQYGADALMSIRRAGGTRSQHGLFHVIYDVKLVDSKSNKLVWRANVNFYRGELIPVRERGEALAIDLTNKMKEDKIWSSCPMVNQTD